MGLAELRSVGGYRVSNNEWQQSPKSKMAAITRETIYHTASFADTSEFPAWKRIELQARRPVAMSTIPTSNHPEVGNFVYFLLNSIRLISIAFAITAFFMFLLEISVGRAGVMLWSFSGTVLFSVIALISGRVKRAIHSYFGD